MDRGDRDHHRDHSPQNAKWSKGLCLLRCTCSGGRGERRHSDRVHSESPSEDLPVAPWLNDTNSPDTSATTPLDPPDALPLLTLPEAYTLPRSATNRPKISCLLTLRTPSSSQTKKSRIPRAVGTPGRRIRSGSSPPRLTLPFSPAPIEMARLPLLLKTRLRPQMTMGTRSLLILGTTPRTSVQEGSG